MELQNTLVTLEDQTNIQIKIMAGADAKKSSLWDDVMFYWEMLAPTWSTARPLHSESLSDSAETA